MAIRTRSWRTWGLALAVLVGVSAAGCMVLGSQRARARVPAGPRIRAHSGRSGPCLRRAWLTVARDDGAGTQRVHAWWLPAAAADAPTLLYLHGTRWSLGNSLFRIARLHGLGFNVLAIDYRGFGRSDGDLPSEVADQGGRACGVDGAGPPRTARRPPLHLRPLAGRRGGDRARRDAGWRGRRDRRERIYVARRCGRRSQLARRHADDAALRCAGQRAPVARAGIVRARHRG